MNEIAWDQHFGWPLLATLQLLPLAGAALVAWLGERPAAVLLGRLVALGEVLLAFLLYGQLDKTSATMQFAERVDRLGYHAAADGMTVLFVLLASLIVLLVALYGLVRGLQGAGRLLALTLLAESALMAMLVTTNLLWFFLASLGELAVVAHMIGRWSTSTEDNRQLAVTRFLQFQGVGALMFGLGLLIVAWGHADVTGRWSFELADLAQVPPQGRFQSAAFFLLFYGLGVRTPLFPLHGWLPHVAHRGMVAIAPALLLGVKVGIYGMLRYLLPLTGEAVLYWQKFIVGFAMAGVFYAAFLALLQGNLRRLLSFAVVSHTSLIVVGLFTLHPAGLAGAVLLSVNFGFAATVMLFMVGLVFRRTHSTDLVRLGGLFERIPFIAACFLVGGLSIVGMPGTPGFDAAHLVLEAAIGSFGALPTIATALGNVLAAGFLLYAFQRAFLAAPPEGTTVAIERTQPMEYLVGGLAVAVLLLAGFFFEPWLALIEPVANALLAGLGGV